MLNKCSTQAWHFYSGLLHPPNSYITICFTESTLNEHNFYWVIIPCVTALKRKQNCKGIPGKFYWIQGKSSYFLPTSHKERPFAVHRELKRNNQALTSWSNCKCNFSTVEFCLWWFIRVKKAKIFSYLYLCLWTPLKNPHIFYSNVNDDLRLVLFLPIFHSNINDDLWLVLFLPIFHSNVNDDFRLVLFLPIFHSYVNDDLRLVLFLLISPCDRLTLAFPKGLNSTRIWSPKSVQAGNSCAVMNLEKNNFQINKAQIGIGNVTAYHRRKNS